MSITSKLLLTIFFCSAQQAKYSRHKQLIMIYRLLADLYKTVKIHHDNTEVSRSMWFSCIAVPFSCFNFARFRSVGLNFGYKISKFGAGRRRQPWQLRHTYAHTKTWIYILPLYYTSLSIN